MEQEIKAQIEHLKSRLSAPNCAELLGYVDYTSLNSTDSASSISTFCSQVNAFHRDHAEVRLPAVCVYPNYVAIARESLDPSVKVACVSTAFPEGQTFSSIKVLETQLAVSAGADEVDMVIHRGNYLSGNLSEVGREIESIKTVCESSKLKVILEVSDLPTSNDVLEVSRLAINSGADFIKTSTGKGNHGATPHSFFAMCLAVENHFRDTGKKIGLKAAGGIRTAADAWLYRSIVAQVLGESWLNPDLFRIGASSLAAGLERALFPEDKHYL